MKPKVVLFCNNDISSNIIFSKIFNNDEFIIKSVFISKTLINKKQKFQVIRLLKKLNFRVWSFYVFINLFFKIYEKLNLFLNLKKNISKFSIINLASKNKIPIFFTKNINSEKNFKYLKEISPDIILIRINQLIEQNIIELPKKGIWCIHSSLLPSYKGIAGEFHALKNNEEVIGSSIFKVKRKLDSGKVYYQKSFEVKNNNTLFDIIFKNNKIASKMIIKFLKNKTFLKYESKNIYKPIKNQSYFSWPSDSDYYLFKKRRKLINYGQILDLIRGNIK